MSKEITVPAAVVIRDPDTGEVGQTLSLRAWAFSVWLNDARWHKDLSRLIIVTQEFNKKEGQKMSFEDADYDLLSEIVKDNPQVKKQPPLAAMQFEGFKALILNASKAK